MLGSPPQPPEVSSPAKPPAPCPIYLSRTKGSAPLGVWTPGSPELLSPTEPRPLAYAERP